MPLTFPSTTYACPCSDLTSAPLPTVNKRASLQPTSIQLNQDQTLNPHSPRANYALYPLDHLLFCDECDAVRCPRCWTEEILYWYCPSCLFEVPSSAVRGDGNRCARSCYDCPICTAQLHVTQISNPKDGHSLKPSDAAGADESYILQCQYCDWSSLDIDVQFSKSTKITEQLIKLRKGRTSADAHKPSHEEAFAKLADFYKDQLTDSTDAQTPFANSPYGSPANLARIMSLYGGLPYNALKKSREKPQPMREASQPTEGLVTYTATDSDATILQQMQTLGWDGIASSEQRHSSPANHSARFVSDLWPSATPLRTRRGRRCKTCRQFLTRPEQRVGSLKYKIRLLAINYVPRLSIRPFPASIPLTNPAFHLRPEPVEQETLQPYQTKQYILTVRNPLFESVRISLATPATTPGRVASKVTILCPSFTVGPAGEIWDDALAASASTAVSADGGRSAAMASLTGTGGAGGSSESAADRQPEAGKVWEKSRNSTSVIVEIVPGSLAPPPRIVDVGKGEGQDAGIDEDETRTEDDNVLEIPVYVRAEWEVVVKPGETVQARKDADTQPGEKVRKELGYWVVLAVGEIAG